MTTNELHWLAGLLEGEACFHIPSDNASKKNKYVRLSMQMNDEDVMRKAANLIGAKLYAPYKSSKTWQIQVTSKNILVPLLTDLLPLMGERRASKIKAMLVLMEGYSGYKVKERVKIS